MRRISHAEGVTIAKALFEIPKQVHKILKLNNEIKEIVTALPHAQKLSLPRAVV